MRPSLLLAVALGLSLALVRVSVALAHAVMLWSAPNPNGFLDPNNPPTRVEIAFSEEVAPAFSGIRVLNQSGEAVDNGDTQAINVERTILAVSLKPLQPGTYTVAWEVLSAVDGHPSSGSFTFGVGVEVTAPVGAASVISASTPASITARWLTLTGQVILLGVFAFRLFIWRPALNPNAAENAQLDLAMARQAIRVGWVALGLVGSGLLLTLIAQQAAIGGFTVAGLRAWLGTRFGQMWAIRFWLSVGLVFGLTDLRLGLKVVDPLQEGEGMKGLKGWVWWAGLALSVALGLTSTLVSHSAALQVGAAGGSSLLAVASDGAHILAAGVWVGGLVQLYIATRLIQTVPGSARVKHILNLALNFSSVAASAVGVLLVSGAYLAAQHVGTWAALFGTAYGVALLTKMGLALPAFAVATVNLLVVKPGLSAAVSSPDPDRAFNLQRRFYRLVLVEGSFALAVAAAAGFLTDFQRGRDALLLSERARATLVQSADDLNVMLAIEPASWGQTSTFDIYLVGADEKPVATAREVSLRFNYLDRSLGRSEVTAESLGNGHYNARGSYLSLGGTWEAEIAVRRPDAYDTFATFQLKTDTDGVIRPLNPSSNLKGRLVAWLTQRGGWLTGGALIVFALGWGIVVAFATRSKTDFVFLLMPSLIAMWVGVNQIVAAMSGSPLAPSGDPKALAWLAESDAAMNRLTSLRLLRTTRGDSDRSPVLTETVAFQAPNLFYDRLSNGSENMAQGHIYYYRQPGEPLWQAVRQNEPFVFSNFDLSRQALSARLGKIEEMDGRRAQTVTFTIYILRKPVAFIRWIDVETRLTLREYMDAPGHHMLSLYHAYNEPVVISIPGPSEIGPTPTVTIP